MSKKVKIIGSIVAGVLLLGIIAMIVVTVILNRLQSEPTYESLLSAARTEMEQHNYESAIREYDSAIEHMPDTMTSSEIEVYLELIDAYLALGGTGNAEGYYQKVLAFIDDGVTVSDELYDEICTDYATLLQDTNDAATLKVLAEKAEERIPGFYERYFEKEIEKKEADESIIFGSFEDGARYTDDTKTEVEFGWYPRTKVDADTVEDITFNSSHLAEKDGVVYYEYIKDDDTSEYFIVEKLCWEVLTPLTYDEYSNCTFLYAKEAIDSMPFNYVYGDYAWADSDLREFLNGEFIEMAFSENDTEQIAVFKYTPSVNPIADIPYMGADCEDKVSIMSYLQISVNCFAGYDIGFPYVAENRLRELTDYAISRGALTNGEDRYAKYWLSTSGASTMQTMYVYHDGVGSPMGDIVSANGYAAVPMIIVVTDYISEP